MSEMQKPDPTRIDEIAEGFYRIHTPLSVVPGGFTFNQYLLRDEHSLLFHTGPRGLFPQISDAIASVMPLEDLRYIGFSHVESDECGSLNQFLGVAPQAVALCGRIAAMTSVHDLADRPPKVLADGETLQLGRNTARWIDAPHVPHGWENGYLMIEGLGALLCGDLFTQPGADHPPIVETDILGPSEAMRARMDYYAHAPQTGAVLKKLGSLEPRILACMHGSAWRGDGATMLNRLAKALSSAQV